MDQTIEVAASAPGKVILFGEHAVVHSQPAIAASLDDLRISCHVRCEPCSSQSDEGLITIQMPDFSDSLEYQALTSSCVLNEDIVAKAPSDHVVSELKNFIVNGHLGKEENSGKVPLQDYEIEALTPLLFLANGLLRDLLSCRTQSISILIRSRGLPVGAGLGSSAAFCVAVSAAFHKLRTCLNLYPSISVPSEIYKEIPDEVLDSINNWAFAAEGVIHGNPSGLDNTVSCYGGAVYYQKDSASGEITAFEKLKIPPLDMILTNTFIPRSTKALVAGVGRRKHSFSFMDDIFSAIGKISDQFRNSLDPESKDHRDSTIISDLIRTNQLLLQVIGVSHAALNEICAITDNLGIASKLTGAGGGGCTVSYIEPGCKHSRSEVVNAIESSSYNFQCLESSVGGRGVMYIDITSDNFSS